MNSFQAYTIATAPVASKPTLEEVKRTFGFVPTLHAHMAESPELLVGYTALWDLFAKSTLTPHVQQVVYLTSNFENNCHYCMAVHSTLAKKQDGPGSDRRASRRRRCRTRSWRRCIASRRLSCANADSFRTRKWKPSVRPAIQATTCSK
jgi:alkylhydroperoxidase/carboxymuconolactone decarboxylase family protein YurZ